MRSSNLTELEFPLRSCALQVISVWPTLKADPECGLQVTRTLPSIASTARGAGKKIFALLPVILWTLDATFPNTGALVSLTTTVNVALALLPLRSDAVQVTVVRPSGKTPPEGGAQVTGTLPSTASVAEGASNDAFAPALDVASSTTSVVDVREGAVRS